MKSTHGNQPREHRKNAVERSENKNQANQDQARKESDKAGKSGGPCRNEKGRFESCE